MKFKVHSRVTELKHAAYSEEKTIYKCSKDAFVHAADFNADKLLDPIKA